MTVGERDCNMRRRTWVRRRRFGQEHVLRTLRARLDQTPIGNPDFDVQIINTIKLDQRSPTKRQTPPTRLAL